MPTFRCFLPAWIAAWVVAIFLPSVVIAWLGLSPAVPATGGSLERLLAGSWKVADDVGPVVKLMIGGLLLAGFLAVERLSPAGRLAACAAIGVLAMIATIAFVPPDYSRGFAAALTGARFDSAVTPIYLLGALLAGLVYATGSARCRRRSQG
ncbi:hypothetical protein P1X14_11870 [Sphingomonas sp. AOB5]|uniref:hypothetical protein n=1 Tax=Sphingomonas sp. AOB5 TaxID=3034017 RepID=UPI0023F92451|nr:hypothetical protein [Sphingomonas sp. AOB5]MDF7775945.1 hypothetical protein [Sphingomonas sp. AOB5]